MWGFVNGPLGAGSCLDWSQSVPESVWLLVEPTARLIEVGESEYIAACQSEEGGLKDWGVLRRTVAGQTRWSCTTCTSTKSNCPHALKAPVLAGFHSWSRATLDSRMRVFFDEVRGTRRLTCISRNAIPVTVRDSARQGQYHGVIPFWRLIVCVVIMTVTPVGYFELGISRRVAFD